ncbi:MAG: SprT-like domain-containing protein [Phycisphaeraceae bacterium]
MIRAVFFDFGGVVATLDRDEMAAIEGRYSLPAGGLWQAMYATDEWHALKTGRGSEKDWVGAIRRELDGMAGRPVAKDIGMEWVKCWRGLDDGIMALLQALKARYRIGMISNATLTLEDELENHHRIHHHFEVIVANPRGPVSAPARQAVLHYPPLQRALAEIRAMPARRSGRNGGGLNGLNGLNGRNGRGAGNGRPGRAREVGPNCATPGQQAYLEALYAFLNRTRFDDRLPSDIPLRLSSRMKSTYGWVMLQRRNGKRTIGELALNLDLMLEENDAKRLDIMLHEMAHIAAWLLHGERGHGAVWKRIARGLGCEPRACTRQKIQKRSASRTRISRVPPLPDSRPRQ